MRASGWTVLGAVRLADLCAGPSAPRSRRRATGSISIGLTDRADDPAGDLPYGAQRELEIARAMCTDPVLLCLDEPAAGLNPSESAELARFLRTIRDEHATSILLIEHDMSVVMEISDHVVVLDHGVKIADGTPGGRAQRPEGDRRLSRRRGRRSRQGRSGGRAVTSPLLSRARREDLLRQHRRAEGRRRRRRRRRDRGADRRQRRRQVDADDDDLRQPARARGLDHLRRPATSPACRRTRSRGCGSRRRRRAGASSRA